MTPDDPDMGKILLLAVVFALLGTAQCYAGGPDVAALPIVGPMIEPQAAVVTPKYVSAIGTPAPVAAPESDFATWFPATPRADPYETEFWKAVDDAIAVASTPPGWAEVCKKATAAAGPERATNPRIGALACSADPAALRLQRLAAGLLGTQAALALWSRGVPGFSSGTVQARQGEVRLACAAETARLGSDSPVAQSCLKALDTSYLAAKPGDTFAALDEAYATLATAIATLAPKTAAEPATFEAKK